MKTAPKTPRKYRWHFSFRVGGKKRGYDANVEVQATSQKSAANKVRQRIKAMGDVDESFKVHFSEVCKGLPVLVSDGHDEIGFNKLTRPAPLRKPKQQKEFQQRVRRYQ